MDYPGPQDGVRYTEDEHRQILRMMLFDQYRIYIDIDHKGDPIETHDSAIGCDVIIMDPEAAWIFHRRCPLRLVKVEDPYRGRFALIPKGDPIPPLRLPPYAPYRVPPHDYRPY